MQRIAGVTTQKDTKGNITHVTINVKKHKEVITPVLEKLGLVQKSNFQIECENGFTVEQSRELEYAKIDSLWEK